MSSADEKDQALTLRLPRELHDQLRECAQNEERTISGILRIAARRYVREQRISAPLKKSA
jgi:hypothetical protein